MNRTQKKCFIATTGFHLLLVVTVVFGSAFFASQSKEDKTEVLTFLPDVTDGPSSGVKNPTPPPANPNPPQKPVDPVPPKPTVNDPPKHVDPPAPKPPKLPPVNPTPMKDNNTPKPPERVNNLNLNTVITGPKKTKPAKPDTHQPTKSNPEAVDQVIANLSKGFSSATIVDMPGDSSVSYANYATYVRAKYDAAWDPSNDISDGGVVTVSVTISSDGMVTDSHIITSSGDPRLDASVKKALNQVTFVHEFPEGAKEKEKTFKINFNLKAKRMLG